MSADRQYLDSATLASVRRAYDQILACIPKRQQTSQRKIDIAVRLLSLAANGERDAARLRNMALEARTAEEPT